MKTSKSRNLVLKLSLAFLMTNIPSVLFANSDFHHNQKMISTSAVLEDFSRDLAEKEIEDFIGRGEVEAQLLKQGISPNEISERLASLSDQEMRQLSIQVKEARAGGDILYTILVLLLIIFLVQRI